MEELDVLAKSFSFGKPLTVPKMANVLTGIDQCVQRTKLNEILRQDAAQQ